jgi:hypothetical protein
MQAEAEDEAASAPHVPVTDQKVVPRVASEAKDRKEAVAPTALPPVVGQRPRWTWRRNKI